MLGDLGVLDLLRLVDRLALDPLGRQRAGGDRRAAAEGLELGVLDPAVGAYPDLQLHDVATGRRADEPGADAGIVLVQRADIARVLVVLDQFVAIAHVVNPPNRSGGDARPSMLALNALPI